MKFTNARTLKFVGYLLLANYTILTHGPANAATDPYWGNGIMNSCSAYIMDHDSDNTVTAIEVSIDLGKYEQAETILDCLTDESFYFASGESGASAVSQFYINLFKVNRMRRGSENTLQKSVRITQDWLKQRPESEYAKFAELRAYYDEAWHYRGSRYINKTPEENYQIFQSTLEEAQDILLDEKSPMYGTAQSAYLLFAVILDLENPAVSPIDVYEQSISQWPMHFRFHKAMLNRLVPRWGGSWPLVDDFIGSITELTQRQSGQALYAYLYHHIHTAYNINPQTTDVSWEKLKPALAELVITHYGNDSDIITASYACFYEDWSLYDRYRPSSEGYYRIFGEDLWVNGTNWKYCQDKLNNQ